MVIISKNRVIIVILLHIIILTVSIFAEIQPDGDFRSTRVTNYSYGAESFMSLNPISGDNSNIQIIALTQTSHWKAIVGNITGTLALWDSDNQSFYEWTIDNIAGEIYAISDSSIVEWENIRCANQSHISQEENKLNVDCNDEDSINKTFKDKIHKAFTSSYIYFEENECFAIKTNINSAEQDEYFQEILLYSGSNIIYTGILEKNITGFNNKHYDFQLILPNYVNLDSDMDTVYYFYLELR